MYNDPADKVRAEIKSEIYADAAREVLRTPADLTNRDLASLTAELAKTAGVLGTPEHAAFQREQAERGEQITRTLDPFERAELRQDRDAAGHAYAAGLADKLGSALEVMGQGRDADELHKLADLHREIAGELRGGGQPPEGPTPPDRGGPDASKREFAEAAKEAGQEALGRSAEVILTTEAPTRPKDEATPAEPKLQSEFAATAQAVGREASGRTAEVVMEAEGPIRPEDRAKAAENALNIGAFRVPTPSGDAIVTGPVHGLRKPEANDGPQDELSAGVAGQIHEATAGNRRDESSREQVRDEDALRGTGEARRDPMAHLESRLAAATAAIEKEERDGPSADAPQQEHGASRSFGRYASLAL